MENKRIYGIEGVSHLYSPFEEKGLARTQVFEVSETDASLFNIRNRGYDKISAGTYVKLYVNNKLMMSDTPMERATNREFVMASNGTVLIAGLGIGMVLNEVLKKESVTKVIIIEKHKDVIDLVSPKFKSDKLEIINLDIFDYKPSKDLKFDTIYFDIWADICVDNLDEIKTLHNRFKNKLNRTNSDFWMNSWVKEQLQTEKRRDRQYSYY